MCSNFFYQCFFRYFRSTFVLSSTYPVHTYSIIVPGQKMALLDNMYAPYSHLMRYHHHQSVAESNHNTTDPSITRLDINVSGSSESSPTSGSGGGTHPLAPPSSKVGGPTAHYGGVMTMNLKLEPNNFRGFSTGESPGQENNINGENRREQHKVEIFFSLLLQDL